jgi:teichuronic acid biosynthesis glycosyltransferase TuaC
LPPTAKHTLSLCVVIPDDASRTGEKRPSPFQALRAVKVLVFTTVFPNTTQPVHGLFVAERTRHAAELVEISVISPVAWFQGKARATDEFRGSHVLSVEHPRFYYIPGLFKFLDGLWLFLSALPAGKRLKERFDFDLIDAHFGFPDGVAAILLGYWFKRPVTVTLRGSELEMARYRLRRLVLSWALRRADRVIAVSSELADLALELGVRAERIRVIGNGVDLTRFRPLERLAARTAVGVPESARLIVSVGHLARVKGFDLILRTLPELLGEYPDLRFVIVGGAAASSGAYPDELATQIDRLGLPECVAITGVVAPDRVALWLSAADVFVLASEREGSPNALREALACGCPVVASNTGDIQQMVPEHAGLIVQDRNSLSEWQRALSAALRRRWDRHAIRSVAEQHSWSDVAGRVMAEWQTCSEAGAAEIRARASVR